MTKTHSADDIPPPLPESDVPLMGNPVLTRRTRRQSAHVGWYIGAPLAVVALGAGAFLLASQFGQQSSLTAPLPETPAPPPVATQTVPAPAPVVAPVAPPVQVATASPTETPVAPPPAITPHVTRVAHADRVPVHHTVRPAPAAAESGADVSATAPIAAAPAAPPILTPPPPPVMVAPPSPPVMAPPPS